MSSSNRIYDPLSSSPSSQKYDHIKVCLVAYSPTNLYDLLLSYWPFLWETVWNTLFILSMHMYVVSNHRLTDVPLSDSHWPIEWDGIGIWGRGGWMSLTLLCLVPHICVGELGQQRFRQGPVAYSAPSHHMNQCRLIVNRTHGNKHQWNSNRIQNFAFEAVVWSVKWRRFCQGGEINFNTLAVIFYSLCGLFHISTMLICFVLSIFVSVVQYVSCILMPT